ncbi:MAG: antirestriction protein ArdA [Jatrophihabitantaceae bacterium]
MNAEQPPISEQPEPARNQPPPAERHEVDIVVPPQIWVASLADYNNGTLHGAWLNAARDEAELQADIAAMLAASPLTVETGEPAEEWAIFDYDGFAPLLRIDEHENLSWVSLVAKGIAQHGPAFAAYADVVEEEELLAGFEEAYLGHYDDLHTYVEQLINDLGYDRILDENLPATVRPYVKIDIAATSADLLRDLHALPAADGGVWIFKMRTTRSHSGTNSKSLEIAKKLRLAFSKIAGYRSCSSNPAIQRRRPAWATAEIAATACRNRSASKRFCVRRRSRRGLHCAKSTRTAAARSLSAPTSVTTPASSTTPYPLSMPMSWTPSSMLPSRRRSGSSSTSTLPAWPSHWSAAAPCTPSRPPRSASGYSTAKSNRQACPAIVELTICLQKETPRNTIDGEMRRTSLTPIPAQQLAELLRSHRQAAGLSMRQLAHASGVNVSVVSQLEAGARPNPLPDTLKALARVLNLPITDLFVTADWLPADELPTLKPYLRAKYRDLDEQAIADIEAYTNQRAQQHGTTGPVDREDEQP